MRGHAATRAAARMQDVPVWEEFEDAAGHLHGSVLDLSVSTADLLKVWQEVLRHRHRWQQLDEDGRLEWPQAPGAGDGRSEVQPGTCTAFHEFH